MGCHISHKWRTPKVMVGLMAVEVLGTVAALALFGIASPNTYRTAMWQIGGDNGFNSSPSLTLYAYANYRPIPATPLVWQQIITDFNVVCAVFSMFMLLAKATMFAMHIWVPLLSIIINTIITALWIVSLYGQIGPDYSDPKFPSSVAWYVTKSCDYARPSGNYGNCQQAKASVAVTIIMLSLFVINLCLGIFSVIPTKEQKEKRRLRRQDIDELDDSPTSENAGEKAWEMRNVPRTPTAARQPFTPRTLAFNTLDRQLPLRTS